MPLDFMFNYIGGKKDSVWEMKVPFAHFTHAEKEEVTQFINKQLSMIDMQSPIPLSSYYSQSWVKGESEVMGKHGMVPWRSMVSANPYWTNSGRINWRDMKVGDVIAWACPSCGWDMEIWFIKLLEKRTKDYKVHHSANPSRSEEQFRFGYIFLSNGKKYAGTRHEYGYHITDQKNIFVKAIITDSWQTDGSSNIYGSSKGVWRKIGVRGGFINWVNETPFSEKP